ncbi:UNVERIFIED_CONTAM: Pyruvate, phosphate dikinase, chloroplastic [Sesamum radiatum]|uniref:Pyruvate, phosphate dikinase, chloroplastic n=1 Tax=Sesamum radiatum TaxID=300843 RepID=A0AAW2UC20_SESRA
MSTTLSYKVGTMIEIPRAALVADEVCLTTLSISLKFSKRRQCFGTDGIITYAYFPYLCAKIAKEAEFFSFGTNDLTQMTFGYSRDDVGKFLPIYLAKGILQNDPFEVGICGEHGGPSSVAFFAAAGLDYVSCSPFRVPIARLAAAQAAV